MQNKRKMFYYTDHASEEKEHLQDLFTKINYAVNNHYQIESYYESYYNKRLRLINPYDLFNVDYKWYWIGYEIDTQIFKIYRLDRTKNVSVGEKQFWIDSSYN